MSYATLLLSIGKKEKHVCLCTRIINWMISSFNIPYIVIVEIRYAIKTGKVFLLKLSNRFFVRCYSKSTANRDARDPVQALFGVQALDIMGFGG